MSIELGLTIICIVKTLRIQINFVCISDSLKTTTNASDDRDTRAERPRSPVPPRETPSQPQSTPQFVFPTRLHLQELEVDVLRVNDLSAHSINVEHLSAPNLQVRTNDTIKI